MVTQYRVVMHAHSTWSYDGHLPLDRIARLYGRLGADAVMMSEHDTGFAPERFDAYRTACVAASTRRCQLIPGIEYSSPDNDIHFLVWGVRRFLGEHRPVIDTLRDVRAEGGVAILAHPIRRAAWRKISADWLPLLDGIELWNRKSDGISWGREALKMVAAHGLPATVGHDFHRRRQIWPLSQRFDLSDTPRTPDALETALVRALRAGDSSPFAFGRELRGDGGLPSHLPYPAIERARCGLRDLRNWVWRRARF